MKNLKKIKNKIIYFYTFFLYDKLADLVGGGSGPLIIDKGVCRTSSVTPVSVNIIFSVKSILDFLVLAPTILIIN